MCCLEDLSTCPAGGSTLLVYQDGSPLTQFQFQAVFKQAMAMAECSAVCFSFYSFKIGIAFSTVAESQDPRHTMGHWCSRVYQ